MRKLTALIMLVLIVLGTVSVIPAASAAQVRTISDVLNEGDTKTYTLGEKTYEVTVDYVGGTCQDGTVIFSGAKFSVNNEVTSTLKKGDTYRFVDGSSITLTGFIIQCFAGGIKRAEFILNAPAGEVELPADLAITGLSILPVVPVVNNEVTFNVRVSNNGPSGVMKEDYAILVEFGDGNSKKRLPDEDLPAGKSVMLQVAQDYLKAGKFTVNAKALALRKTDSDLTNNIARATVTIVESASGGGGSGGGGGGIGVPAPTPTPIAPPPELPVVFVKLDEKFTLQKGQTAILSDYRSMHVELKGVESKFCAAVVGQECPGPVATVEVSVSEPVFRTQSSSGSASASGGAVAIATASRATAAIAPAKLLTGILSEGETAKYEVNGKWYEVTLEFAGTYTAKFTVNGEVTDSLHEGNTQTLKDGTQITLNDLLQQDSASGARKAKFTLSVAVGGGGGGVGVGPDLAVKDMRVSTKQVHNGAFEAIFNVVVKNVGSTPTRDYGFSLDFGDGTGATFPKGATLPIYPLRLLPGESKYESIGQVIYVPGSYTATFFAYTSNDADTSNDKKSVTFDTSGGGSPAPIVPPPVTSPEPPISSPITPPIVGKVLKLSNGESATAFDATITALDVSSGKATFVVSKKVYISDVVDIGITPRVVNVGQGSVATYTVTVQDKHPGIVCKPGQICPQALPAYAYSVEVIGLPFETSYEKNFVVEAGTKKDFVLSVDTSRTSGQPLPIPEPQPIEEPRRYYIEAPMPEFDLVKYPNPFVRYGKELDAVIVVGSTAAASDVVSAVDIATGLQHSQEFPISVGSAVLDKDVADPFAQNVITVGTPCTNKVTAAWWSGATGSANVFPPGAEPCNFGSLKEGTAMIKLVQHHKGAVGLIVSGTKAVDTRKAAQVLANYKEWQKKGRLKGTEVHVSGPFNYLDVRPVEEFAQVIQAIEETDRSASAVVGKKAEVVAVSADVVRKCLNTGDNYERCLVKEGKSVSVTTTATIAATAVAKAKVSEPSLGIPEEPVPRLSTYRFAVRVTGSGNSVDVAYATLNIQPKEPTEPTPVPRRLPPCGNYGDVDQDGYVSVKDANLVSNYTVGNVQLTGLQKKNAEVTGDGIVDIGDALFIAQHVKGLRSTFPVCGSSEIIVVPPPIEVQPVEKVSISLERGWNLVSLPGKVVTFLPSDCTKSRKLLGFIYLQDKDGKGGGKYVSLQEARRQLGSEFSDYLSQHAFWVYSYNGCTFQANVQPYAGYDELSLQPGWNLLPVTSAMVGKNLNELNVNCEFEKLYSWDSGRQSWSRLTQDYAFGQADVNKGLVAKTGNYCEFGGELTISPPDLPD